MKVEENSWYSLPYNLLLGWTRLMFWNYRAYNRGVILALQTWHCHSRYLGYNFTSNRASRRLLFRVSFVRSSIFCVPQTRLTSTGWHALIKEVSAKKQTNDNRKFNSYLNDNSDKSEVSHEPKESKKIPICVHVTYATCWKLILRLCKNY